MVSDGFVVMKRWLVVAFTFEKPVESFMVDQNGVVSLIFYFDDQFLVMYGVEEILDDRCGYFPTPRIRPGIKPEVDPRTPLDRIGAMRKSGWVRELQGRWPGVNDVRWEAG